MKQQIDPAYQAWASRPTPAALRQVVQQYSNMLPGVLAHMGIKDSPVIRGRAEVLMAQAVKNYNPATGVPLKNWIQQELRGLHRVARQVSEVVSIPERVRRDTALLKRSRDELNHQLGREPSMEELADATGVSVKRQQKLGRYTTTQINESQFAEMEADDEASMVEPGVHRVDPHQEWQDYVYHDLDDVDKQIFQHRTGYRGHQRLDNNALAKRVGLSPSALSHRARKIEERLTSHG